MNPILLAVPELLETERLMLRAPRIGEAPEINRAVHESFKELHEWIKPELQKFIDDQVKNGHYDSAEEVVEAGLAILEQQARYGTFTPGELDRLLAEGEADIACGKLYDGEEVFRELDELSAARRRAMLK